MRNVVNKMWNIAMYGSLAFMVVVLIGLYSGLVVQTEKYIVLSAELGTFVLFWMLLSKNISKYTKKKKGENKVMQFIRFNALRQREQGITSFNFFALHVVTAIIVVLNSPLELIRQIISGAAVTIIFIYLIITSIKGVQQKNKAWKATHSVVWMAFPLIMFHIYELEPSIPTKYWVMFIILIISVIVGMCIKMSRKRSTRQAKISLASLLFIVLQFVILSIISAYQDITTSKELSSDVVNEDNNVQSDTANNDSSSSDEDTSSTEESSDEDTSSIDSSSDEDTSSIDSSSDEDTSSTEESSVDDSSSSDSSSSDSSSTNTASTSGYTDGTYQGTGTGYHGGQTTVSVTVASGKITTINIDSIQDTPGFYEEAVQVIPQEIIDSQSTDVQTVSGATFSSMGIMNAVDDALTQA